MYKSGRWLCLRSLSAEVVSFRDAVFSFRNQIENPFHCQNLTYIDD
jgi:hypothetical protein